MPSVRVTIPRFVDNYQPGIVECLLVDVHRRTWEFIVKVPIVTAEDLGPESRYPKAGLSSVRSCSGQSMPVVAVY